MGRRLTSGQGTGVASVGLAERTARAERRRVSSFMVSMIDCVNSNRFLAFLRRENAGDSKGGRRREGKEGADEVRGC